MTQVVRYDSDGAVSTIAMDDGKANVLSLYMLRELNAALDLAEAERTVVLLTGRAGMFSGGFDLAVFKRSGEEQIDMLLGGARTALRLLSFPAPVVIACSGHAIAMGAFLALSADVRIGISAGPFQICVKEVEIGLTLPRFAIEVCRQRLRRRTSIERRSPQSRIRRRRRAKQAFSINWCPRPISWTSRASRPS
jgi:enoyl-CoA hydratase